jgi:hypothetical protein
MTNTHEHLEHAEHAQHAAHDPFTARVAVTMAIIAAVLGAVTLLSHRAHTETLELQSEANQLFTDVDINHTNATNQWGYYQAKNIRKHKYQTDSEYASFMLTRPEKEKEFTEAQKRWQSQLDDYEKELPQHKADAEKFMADAQKAKQAAMQKLTESHTAHQRTAFYDVGELAVEIGLVLCSIAVLTKKRGFWFGGMAAAAAGALIAASAFLIAPHAEGHEGPAAEHSSTEKEHKPAGHDTGKH